MAITNLITEITYVGNGSTTSFPIPFQILANEQVNVILIDTASDPEVETTLTEGSGFTFDADPASSVEMTTAPAATEELYIFRVTAKTQPYDYIEAGAFKAEDHEEALDRIVMILQELNDGITSASGGGGALARQAAQALVASDTISIGAANRMLKDIQGSGAAITLDATTPIAAGTIDGQEIRLVGDDDDYTVTMLTGGNVNLNGDMVFVKNSILDLFWDGLETKWQENGRKA